MDTHKPLFGQTITPACEYCAKAHATQGGIALFCSASDSAVPTYHRCDKFAYDPLRRVPKRTPRLPTFSLDDFKL